MKFKLSNEVKTGIILLTGILLQIKRWVPIVEPPTVSNIMGKLSNIKNPVALNDLLKVAKSIPSV